MYHFLSPFCIDIEPMLRLLLINFENDPDTTYMGFEPQVFDDAVHGKGHLVIGWRNDGKVDVYHEPSLTPSPKKYDIAGKGLENMIECQFDVAFFEINETGVQANYQFRDVHNRIVRLKITEKNLKERRPFGLLAPMGSAAEKPSAMPLVMLHDFYFVRKSKTDFEVFIDDVQHKPDKLPLPMDRTWMYFARYSPNPLIARLNPEFDGTVATTAVKKGSKTHKQGDYIFDFVWENDSIFLRRLTRLNDVHPIALKFEDPFPDITSMENNSGINGKFTVEADSSIGTIMGDYSVDKNGDTTQIEIRFGGWKPKPDKFSLRFLYTIAGVFKKWPSTYVWNAQINENKGGNYSMTSKWKRI